MIIPTILAGGSGTRLWPLSRQLHPKQLINLVDDNSMLQNTLLRLAGMADLAPPMIICSDNHRFMVAEQLRRIRIESADIILEPVGRNTAPAVAVAAIRALEKSKDAILLVLPADHIIARIPEFQNALALARKVADQNRLVTFGIVPDAPETGYGYIKKGDSVRVNGETILTIDRFVEKPDLETARQYLESGDYFWNSGMFMFRAATVLAELETHAPEMVAACRRSLEQGREDLDFFRLDVGQFAACPADSIDCAVMEKTDVGAMITVDVGWNDLGSWEALYEAGQKDESANVKRGDIITHDVKNSYLSAQSRLLAAVGLENHIVVETADAVLISPRNRIRDVRKLVDKLKEAGRIETWQHRKVYRPWGSFEMMNESERFQVKMLTVSPGSRMSLQKHFHRAEHWVVVKGTAKVTSGEETFLLKEDESTYIPMGIPHRLENPGKVTLKLIEVRTGSYLEEDDIVRLEDDYGRERE